MAQALNPITLRPLDEEPVDPEEVPGLSPLVRPRGQITRPPAPLVPGEPSDTLRGIFEEIQQRQTPVIERNIVGEFGAGMARGLGPGSLEMIGQAARGVGLEQFGTALRGAGTGLQEAAPRLFRPSTAAQVPGSWRSNVYSAAESVGTSLGVSAPALAAAVLSGGGAAPVIGALMLSTPGVFAGAEYQNFFDEGRKAGIPDDVLRMPALASAAAEGGLELLGNVAEALLITRGYGRLAARGLVNRTKGGIKAVMIPKITQTLAEGVGGAAIEGGTEALTDVAQTALRQGVGIPAEGQAGTAFTVGAMAGAIFASVGKSAARLQQRGQLQTLASATAPPEARLAQVNQVISRMEEGNVDQELITQFSNYAADAISQGQPIPLGEDIAGLIPGPPPGPPAPMQGPPSPLQGPPAPMQGPLAPEQGPPAPMQGPMPYPVSPMPTMQAPGAPIPQPPSEVGALLEAQRPEGQPPLGLPEAPDVSDAALQIVLDADARGFQGFNFQQEAAQLSQNYQIPLQQAQRVLSEAISAGRQDVQQTAPLVTPPPAPGGLVQPRGPQVPSGTSARLVRPSVPARVPSLTELMQEMTPDEVSETMAQAVKAGRLDISGEALRQFEQRLNLREPTSEELSAAAARLEPQRPSVQPRTPQRPSATMTKPMIQPPPPAVSQPTVAATPPRSRRTLATPANVAGIVAEAERLSVEAGDTDRKNMGVLIDAFRRTNGDPVAAASMYFASRDDSAPSIANNLREFRQKTQQLVQFFREPSQPTVGPPPGATGAETVPPSPEAPLAAPPAPAQAPPAAPTPQAPPPIVTPSGSSYPFTYEWVPAAETIPSHNPQSFSPNPRYEEVSGMPIGELQGRPYHRDPAEQNKVMDQTLKFPDRYGFMLSTSPDFTHGPPVVPSDSNVTIAGGSRLLTILRIIQTPGQPGYQNYLRDANQLATSMGIGPVPEGMENPILERRLTDVSTNDKEAMKQASRESNEPWTQALNEKAQAVMSGQALSAETVAYLGEQLDALGEEATLRDFFRTATSRELIRRLQSDGVLTQRTINKYVDDQGMLNEDGKTLVERAILGRVLPDSDLIDAAPASTINTISKTLPALTQIEAQGDRWNITRHLPEAVKLITNLTAMGARSFNEMFEQSGLFGDRQSTNPVALSLADAFRTMKPTQFRAAVTQFAGHAGRAEQGGMLFVAPPLPAGEAFNQAFKADLSPAIYQQAMSLESTAEQAATLAAERDAMAAQVSELTQAIDALDAEQDQARTTLPAGREKEAAIQRLIVQKPELREIRNTLRERLDYLNQATPPAATEQFQARPQTQAQGGVDTSAITGLTPHQRTIIQREVQLARTGVVQVKRDPSGDLYLQVPTRSGAMLQHLPSEAGVSPTYMGDIGPGMGWPIVAEYPAGGGAQQFQATRPQTQAQGGGEPWTLTRQEVDASFPSPGYRVLELPEGGYRISTQTGYTDLNEVDYVTMGPEQRIAFQMGYGTPYSDDVSVNGRFIHENGQSRIELLKGRGNRITLLHEFEHWLEYSGQLTQEQIQQLSEATGKGDATMAEDRAEFVARQLNERRYRRDTVIGRILDQIWDYLDRLLALVGIHTTRGIIRGIETGQGLTQGPRSPVPEIPATQQFQATPGRPTLETAPTENKLFTEYQSFLNYANPTVEYLFRTNKANFLKLRVSLGQMAREADAIIQYWQDNPGTYTRVMQQWLTHQQMPRRDEALALRYVGEAYADVMMAGVRDGTLTNDAFKEQMDKLTGPNTIFSVNTGISSEWGRMGRMFQEMNKDQRFMQLMTQKQERIGRLLTPEEHAAYVAEFNKVAMTGDAAALDKFFGKVKAENPTVWDYLKEFWYGSVLSGFPTWIANTGGNTLWTTFSLGALRPVEAFLDHFIAKHQNRPQQYFMAEVLPSLAGFGRGLIQKPRWQALYPGMKTGDFEMPGITGVAAMERDMEMFSSHWQHATWQLDFPFMRKLGLDMGPLRRKLKDAFGIEPGQPINPMRTMAPIVSLGTRALVGMDLLGRAAAYDGLIRGMVERQIQQELRAGDLTEPQVTARRTDLLQQAHDGDNPKGEPLRNAAALQSQELTFVDEKSAIANFALKGRTLPFIGRPFHLLMPFVATADRLIYRAMELVPGLGAFIHQDELAHWKTGGPEVTAILARQVTGVFLSLVMLELFRQGILTGDLPDDPDERDAFLRAGKQPRSFKVGDTYISYQRFEPLNLMLGWLPSLVEGIQRAYERDDQAGAMAILGVAGGIASKHILEASYFSGLNGFIVGLNRPTGDQTESAVGRFVDSWVPFSGARRMITRAVDAYETGEGSIVRDPKGFLEYISGASLVTDVRPRFNTWGRPIVTPGNVAAQFIPYRISVANRDPVENELARFHIFPGPPSQQDAKGQKLPPDQYEFLVQHGGQLVKGKLDRLVGQPYYQQLNDELRKMSLRRAIRQGREEARDELTARARARGLVGGRAG